MAVEVVVVYSWKKVVEEHNSLGVAEVVVAAVVDVAEEEVSFHSWQEEGNKE